MNIEPNNFNRNFENCVKSYRVVENDCINSRIWDSKNKIGIIIEILLDYKKRKNFDPYNKIFLYIL